MHACGTLQGASGTGTDPDGGPGTPDAGGPLDGFTPPPPAGDAGTGEADLGCLMTSQYDTPHISGGAVSLSVNSDTGVQLTVTGGSDPKSDAHTTGTFDVPAGKTRAVVTLQMTLNDSGWAAGAGNDYVTFGGIVNGMDLDSNPYVAFALTHGQVELDPYPVGKNAGQQAQVIGSPGLTEPPGGMQTFTVEVVWGPKNRIAASFDGSPPTTALSDADAGVLGSNALGQKLSVVLGGTTSGMVPSISITFMKVCAVVYDE